MDKRYQKNFYNNKKIDHIMNKLKEMKNTNDVLLIQNKKTNAINLENISLNRGRVYYFKDIISKKGNSISIDTNIEYDHGNLIIVLENMTSNLKIINNSDQFTRCGQFDETSDIIKDEVIEGFNSSNYYCTSGGEIVIIMIIVYLVYRAMTIPDIIKIFN